MNKIMCDKCKEQIKPQIESKHIKNGIQINFFRCNHCGIKTLIDVTDQETRYKQFESRRWAEQKKKALDIIIDDMSEENLKKLTKLADECQFNMDRLKDEIKETKAELKAKYGDLL